MKWIEASVLPEECKTCEEAECYNCDLAGQRWILSQADEEAVIAKMRRRAIHRYEKMQKEHASDA